MFSGLLRVTYETVAIFDQEGKQLGETAITRMEEAEYKRTL